MKHFIVNIYKRYAKNSFFIILSKVIGVLVSLFTLPIILNNLPIEEYGIFQFILALQAWLLALTGNHITSGSIKGLAKGFDGTFFFAFINRIKFLITISVIVLIASFYFYLIKLQILFYLLVIFSVYLVFGYLFQQSCIQFFIAKKQFKNLVTLQITISVIVSISSALVAFFTHNIVIFVLVQLGVSSLISLVWWLYVVRKNNLFQAYKRKEIDRECFSYGLKLIPVDLFIISAGKSSHFIIGSFFGFSNLAVFSVANKLKDRCADFARTIFPSLLYADFANKDRKDLIRIISGYLTKMGIISLFFTFLFISAGWYYIKFFLPETYRLSSLYFIILALSLPAGALSIILHTILESHLRYKELSVVQVVPNLVKIILIIIFGYLWQIIGICIALTISGWVSFVFYYLLTVKKDLVGEIIKGFPILKRLSNF